MKKIFITGENSMTAQALEKALWQDYQIVWSSANKDKLLCDFFSVYSNDNELDVCSRRLLEIMKNRQPDIIVHLAAIVGTELCTKRSKDAIRSNVQGTLNVIKVAKDTNAKLIYFSTTAIYDPKDYDYNKPIIEDTKKNPKTI